MFSVARLSALRTKRRSLRPLLRLRCSGRPNLSTRAASGRSASPPPLCRATRAAPNNAKETTSPYAGMPRCVCARRPPFLQIYTHQHCSKTSCWMLPVCTVFNLKHFVICIYASVKPLLSVLQLVYLFFHSQGFCRSYKVLMRSSTIQDLEVMNQNKVFNS